MTTAYVFAPVCTHRVSWDARRMEKPSSPAALLVDSDASGLSWSEDVKGIVEVDALLDHRVAISSVAQSRLLERSPAGGVVCPRGDKDLSRARRWGVISSKATPCLRKVLQTMA